MLHRYRADLHVHTCLSPCGELEMSPRKIVARVLEQHVDIIAICDHNSAENVPAVVKAAEGKGIVVLAGMEVCTQEEVHVLAIFEDADSAFRMQSTVFEHLTGANDPEVFGVQVIANECDEVEGFEERLLIGAADLSVEDVVTRIHELNGLAIAAHIDRESYSVLGQLGFIPTKLAFDALELSSQIEDEKALIRFAGYRHYPFVRGSDAHVLRDVGLNTSEYLLGVASFREIAMALRNEGGRMLLAS